MTGILLVLLLPLAGIIVGVWIAVAEARRVRRRAELERIAEREIAPAREPYGPQRTVIVSAPVRAHVPGTNLKGKTARNVRRDDSPTHTCSTPSAGDDNTLQTLLIVNAVTSAPEPSPSGGGGESSCGGSGSSCGGGGGD